jgi:hypothetical protein
MVSFGEDLDGELLLVGHDDGVVRRLHFPQTDLRPRHMRELAPTAELAPVPWRYTLEAPSESWSHLGFDDSAWRESPGGFGTVGTPGAIVRTDWRTKDLWLRRAFTAPATSPRLLALRVHHDEDTEIYLNGVLVSQLAHWTQGYTLIPLPEDASQHLCSGKNVLAVHCRQNSGGQYIDLGLVEMVED